ncbi:MAG: hypothetical protein MJY98_08935 [Fibrobacter sp.]|nr:hypothetical protein [Fibrobacter sp.]
MPEDFNFSELRDYLEGQIDLGDAEIYLDEPWTLVRKASAARPMPGNIPPIPRPQPAAAAPAARPAPRNLPPTFPSTKTAPSSNDSSDGLNIPNMPIPDNTGFAGSFFGDIPKAATQAEAPVAPAPRGVKKAASAYESAQSLEEFYGSIKSEALYAKEPQVIRYAGPQNPKLLFLLQAAKPGETAENFLSTPVGEMLVRLFASLGYDAADIGVTYFFKSSDRPLSPLLDAALKKMLSKEVSFIKPEIMVTFGQPLFYKVMGKNKNFDDLAGTAQNFDGVKTVSLVDPYAMVNDKQMKWLTWKIHIPRSGLFTAKV